MIIDKMDHVNLTIYNEVVTHSHTVDIAFSFALH